MLLLLKGRIIQLIQFFPKILIKLLQREVSAFFQVMEKSLFQDADCVFHRRFETGSSDFCRQDYCMVMFSPFCVILV